MKVTKTDKKILAALAHNSRDTMTNISRKTNIPVSEIFDRLKLLEARLGLRYTVVIENPENIE